MNILKENIDWLAVSIEEKETQNLINEALTHNLRVLCQEIIKQIPDILSIYITGSYAASQGTVIVEDNEIKLLSDYDLFVISKTDISKINLNRNLFKKLKNQYEMPGHPTYEIFLRTFSELKTLPLTKFLYDFQEAKCIYGVDYRAIMPKFLGSEIPLSEGLRLLYNRIFGCLLPFSPKLLFHEPDKLMRRHLMFESAKLVLGSCESLLILGGNYSLSMKKEEKIFKQVLLKKFPHLPQKVKSITDLIEQAYEYKLRPRLELEEKALDMWFESRNLALVTFEYYIERLFGVKDSSLEQMMCNFIHRNPHPLIYNVMATIKLVTNYKKLYVRSLFKKPYNALLAIRFYLLFSVYRNGHFNEAMLINARNVLKEHIGITLCKQNPSALWEELKIITSQNFVNPFSPLRFSKNKKFIRYLLR